MATVKSITCSNSQFHVTIIKQCTSYGNEESFTIRTSSTVYFTSPSYGNNNVYTHELCLPLSVNQFNLILYDNYGDSWSSGAYVEIRDAQSRLLVRAVMTNSREQQFTFTRTPVSESCYGVPVKVIKKTTTAAEKESFDIKYGSVIAYSSPPFTNNNQTTLSICLPSTSNSQYTLVMRESGNGTWSGGAWIELRNIYDTVILKTIMTKNLEESIPFSLATGIGKESSWYYRTTYLSNWFSSSNTYGWTLVSFNSSVETSGTVYYRSSFYGCYSCIVECLFRYRYGIVVYLNGWEIYRDNMPSGTITTNTTATGGYEDYDYRGVILPSWVVDSSSNNLAAELHYPTLETRETIDFDALVSYREGFSDMTCYAYPYSVTVSSDDITGSSNCIDWNIDSFARIPGSLSSRSLIFTLEKVIPFVTHLRMWPISTQSIPFVVEAKRDDDSDWETVSTSFSYVYEQWNYIQLMATDTRYRQFKLIMPTNTEVRLFEIQFVSCYETEELEYPFFEYTFYKNRPVVNVIPHESFSQCRISPPLPSGLSISSSCTISGTPTELSEARYYFISAIGEVGSVLGMISVEVVDCSNLFTVRVRSDGYPQDNSWRLHQGRSTSNSIQTCNDFPVSNGYYYFDFCLNPGIYTFQAQDSYGDGWSARSGYTLLFSDEQMELEIMELPSNRNYVTTVFSTVIPFHSDSTEWKVYQGSESVSFDWNSIILDDSSWITCKTSEIPSSSSVTTYIRKSFSIPSISDYRVLNVRMKYEGGVAVYFNAYLVARFNLADEFNANTEALTAHDPTLYSKFHVILSMVEAQARTNVIAFEIHRVQGTSSPTVIFDASGVYGVEACSTVIDSYSQVTSSSLSSGSLEEIMDMNPNTGGQLSSSDVTFIEWTVENLEGSKWNSFNILTGTTVNVFSMDVYGYQYDEQVPLFQSTSSATLISRTKPQILIAPSLLGFRKYRWEYSIISSSSMTIDSLHMAYCKPMSSYCDGIGEYPAVFYGEVSVAHCPYGYKGYSYRECSSGYLSSIKLDRCSRLPQKVVIAKGEVFRFSIPIEGNNLTFSIASGALPTGLTFDEKTGVISGTPTETVISHSVSFDVSSEGRRESFTLELTIQTRLTSFKYPKSSTTLLKGRSSSLIPSVNGDHAQFLITLGELPEGLVLNAETGEISGKPLQTSNSVTITVEARNDLGSLSTSLELTVRILSAGMIFWIVIGVIVVLALIVIGILYITVFKSKRKLPILPLKKVKVNKNTTPVEAYMCLLTKRNKLSKCPSNQSFYRIYLLRI